MHHELVSITIHLPVSHVQNDVEKPVRETVLLIENFIAPSSIIRTFAEFLSHREDNEYFEIKGIRIPFSECDVKVEDSIHVLNAFQTMCKYNIPLSYSICNDLIEYSNINKLSWCDDSEYEHFSNWYKTRESHHCK